MTAAVLAQRAWELSEVVHALLARDVPVQPMHMTQMASLQELTEIHARTEEEAILSGLRFGLHTLMGARLAWTEGGSDTRRITLGIPRVGDVVFGCEGTAFSAGPQPEALAS